MYYDLPIHVQMTGHCIHMDADRCGSGNAASLNGFFHSMPGDPSDTDCNLQLPFMQEWSQDIASAV